MNDLLISVVMPAYNTGKYIKYAIESILNQTYTNFEFIIINDCSTDNTEEIILLYKDKDPRIRYIKNEKNLGNNFSRNIGNNSAKGKYIAIMDSDDISVSNRLEIQQNYLENHPEIGLVGGFIKFFDKKGGFILSYPDNVLYHQSYLFFKNAVGQPAVMFRKNLFQKYNLQYDPECENIGDYHLWFRASVLGIKMKMLPLILLYYRQTETQISFRNIEDRNMKKIPFFKARLAMLGIDLPANEFEILHNIIKGRIIVNEQNFNLLNKLFDLIEKQNKIKKIYNKTSFKAVLFFFRLRLIKYYFLEYKKDKIAFSKYLIKLMSHTGFEALTMFWKNDGKYLNRTGRKTYKPFSGKEKFLEEAW